MNLPVVWRAAVALAIPALLVSPAFSKSTLVVEANDRGSISADAANTPGPTAPYVCGIYNAEEFRSFFQFTLPAYKGRLAAARIRFDLPRFSFESPHPVKLEVRSLSTTAAFADYLNGALYGSVEVARPEKEDGVVSVPLNAAALAQLRPTVAIRMAGLLAGVAGKIDDQYIFGNTSDGNKIQLELTLENGCHYEFSSTAVEVAPEQSTGSLLVFLDGSGCPEAAVSASAPWLTATRRENAIHYQVDANPARTARQAEIRLGDARLLVEQRARP